MVFILMERSFHDYFHVGSPIFAELDYFHLGSPIFLAELSMFGVRNLPFLPGKQRRRRHRLQAGAHCGFWAKSAEQGLLKPWLVDLFIGNLSINHI